MSEQSNLKSKNYINALILLVIVALAIYYISGHFSKSSSIIMSLVGLGTVIFIHELGHFIAGKLSDVRVEAFAVGFGTVVVGFKKCENYLRFRIFPTILLKENDPDEEGLLCIKVPFGGKAGETEYQLRIFPVGGFVKLLGQEDVGSDKPSDDPRSFLNKPIWKRIIVGSAGVAMNVILAGILFVIVFTVGIRMMPAVVGDCIPGYPADKAGLKAGDEIIEVDGKRNLDFRGMAIAAAFSGRNEPVSLKVQRTDGSIEDISIVAENMPGLGFRGFGIMPASSLEIAKVETPEVLLEQTGLKEGDVLADIDGEKIEKFWQYSDKMQAVFEPMVTLSFQRPGQTEPVVFKDRLEYIAYMEYQEDGTFVPAQFCGLIPRLKIISIEKSDVNEILHKGDVIVQIEDVPNPTYKELRQATVANLGEELSMVVLRDNELVEAKVTPRDEQGRAVIGIGVGLDVNSPVIASAADMNSPVFTNLPRGAEIVTIAGEKVNNYFDIVAVLEKNRGKTVKVDYSSVINDGDIRLAVPSEGDLYAVRGLTFYDIPFKPMTKLFRAAGKADALKMGARKTVEFIAQTYMTIKGLIIGDVSPKSLMGPVGMIAASSKIIADKDYIQYIHFMGIISACLAVMNFLPLPILDGGLVVLLIIEKIKGSPVHSKVQEGLVYIGLALIGALFIMITYNDIIRVFFSR
ncbi:MAG: site-2 protease family protein [Phycisphaerae bacterium]|jgi:regulator of sigma E protease